VPRSTIASGHDNCVEAIKYVCGQRCLASKVEVSYLSNQRGPGSLGGAGSFVMSVRHRSHESECPPYGYVRNYLALGVLRGMFDRFSVSLTSVVAPLEINKDDCRCDS
jgi:hypothetical protein